MLTSILADIDGDGDLDRVSLFAGGLQDWYWGYVNEGLKRRSSTAMIDLWRSRSWSHLEATLRRKYGRWFPARNTH